MVQVFKPGRQECWFTPLRLGLIKAQSPTVLLLDEYATNVSIRQVADLALPFQEANNSCLNSRSLCLFHGRETALYQKRQESKLVCTGIPNSGFWLN